MAADTPYQAESYFNVSYSEHASYPINLVYRASYRKVLESYKNRLDKASSKLFLREATKDQLDVRIRDYDDAGKEFHEVLENDIYNLAGLRVHLGDFSNERAWKFKKTDPKCRYILIHSNKNRLPLKISRGMLNLLFSFHQVMPSYLDFVSVFGLQLNQREVRFSGFHEQNTLAVSAAKRPAVPQLGRSGYGYQLCYNLKAVVDKGGKEKDRWSIRQAALHHQFDVGAGTALWICTEGRKEGGLFDRIRDLTSDARRMEDWMYGTKAESFRSSLATHLACCHWSIEEWRVYVGWLENTVEKETQAAVRGNRSHVPGFDRKHYTSNDLQSVQAYEDQVNDLILILEANNDNMQSLSNFYANLITNYNLDPMLREECAEDVRMFIAHVADMLYDAKMQVRRSRLLVKVTADRKALVRNAFPSHETTMSSADAAQILQHLQGQATEATLNLTYMSYKEAIIMRIITIVTLIFLPATFASTFFSTDVVKYQTDDGSASFSQQALLRWLEVTLPLSLVTLGVGFGWYRYQTKKSSVEAILPI